MIRVGKRIVKVIVGLIVVLIGVILVWAGVHQILSRKDREECKPAGDLVEVDGKEMSILVTGSGEHTIVLLPGLGTAAPILDFEPLTNQLAEKNRVVVVEPFGYGWSDQSNKSRTVDQIVEEIHSALVQEGIKGPYVLMPHSISGIYTIAYANTYPGEVEAVIGIDCTLPTQVAYFEGSENGTLPGITKLVCPFGISRLLTMISPETFISKNTSGLYSEANLKQQKQLASVMGYNATVINELNAVDANIAATYDLNFDQNLPLLFFTRSKEGRTPREDNKTSRSFYETYITNSSCQEVVELNGGHYLHWTCSEEMVDLTQKFLETLAK